MTRHGWKCKVRVYMLVRSSLVPRHSRIQYNTQQFFLPARPGGINPPTSLLPMIHGHIHNENAVKRLAHQTFHRSKAPGRSSRFMNPVGVTILTYEVFFVGTFVLFQSKIQPGFGCRLTFCCCHFLSFLRHSVYAHRKTNIYYLQLIKRVLLIQQE